MLLEQPPFLAKFWDVEQCLFYLHQVGLKSRVDLFDAAEGNIHKRLCDVWDKIEFVTQMEFAEAIEQFDDECFD